MKNNFEHKGFTARVEYSDEDNCFVGRVQNVEGLVMFAGDSVEELKAEFVAAVDEYIAAREAAGLPPEKTYSGTFNVRVGADLHRRAQNAAIRCNLSLNEVLKAALQAYLDEPAARPVAGSHNFAGRKFGNVVLGASVGHPLLEHGFWVEAEAPVPSEESWDVIGAAALPHFQPGGKRGWMQ